MPPIIDSNYSHTSQRMMNDSPQLNLLVGTTKPPGPQMITNVLMIPVFIGFM